MSTMSEKCHSESISNKAADSNAPHKRHLLYFQDKKKKPIQYEWGGENMIISEMHFKMLIPIELE